MKLTTISQRLSTTKSRGWHKATLTPRKRGQRNGKDKDKRLVHIRRWLLRMVPRTERTGEESRDYEAWKDRKIRSYTVNSITEGQRGADPLTLITREENTL